MVHVYEEGVRVPLIMRLPGVIPAGLVLHSPRPSVDLLPTVLETVIGADARHGWGDGEIHGESFASALQQEGGFLADRPVFLTRRHYDPRKVGPVEVRGLRYAIRLGDWKYFAESDQGGPELYDLSIDPGELENLIASAPEEAAVLRERLARWERDMGGVGRAQVGHEVDLDEGDRERLKVLGYVQ